MKISVIIPCYNVEKILLSKCINSILEQTFKDFEILMIDDGSLPEYQKAIEEIGTQDQRIRIYHQSNKGVSAARNLGIKNAEGEYIVFVDADDILVPYFFSEGNRICLDTDPDFLIGGNIHLDNRNFSPSETEHLKDYYYKLDKQGKEQFKCNIVGDVKSFGDDGGYFGRGPWTRFVKREIAENHLFNEELKMGEDIVWNLQLLTHCDNVVVANRIWYLYYVNPASANHKYNPNMIENVRKELPCIHKELDFNNSGQKLAYSVHVVDEIMKIFWCFIGNSLCTLDQNQLKIIKRTFYTEEPWKISFSFNSLMSLNRRSRLKLVFYKVRCLFLYLRIKKLFLECRKSKHE